MFNIINNESPDAILHITDPRYYSWLYAIENQVRSKIPICYYHVWDNEPLPKFNRGVYFSCDWIGCISKLTHRAVRTITNDEVPSDYVPHGVNTDIYKPIDTESAENSKRNLLPNGCDFGIFGNNLNMRRKQLPLLIESYSNFCDILLPEEADKTVLTLHTHTRGEGGMDLNRLVDELYPDKNILFSTEKVSEETLNQMYIPCGAKLH